MANEAGVLEKPKEAADELLRGIGLLDIVVGSLYLYLAFWWSGERLRAAFPVTGSAWSDAVLLVCAAAMLGVLNSLPIAVIVAVYRLLVRGAKRDLEEALMPWLTGSSAAALSRDDPIDRAAALCATRAPALYPLVESARLRARAAAGFAAVSTGYAWLASSRGSGSIAAWTLLGSLAMLLVGLLHYRDYLRGLRLALITAPQRASGDLST